MRYFFTADEHYGHKNIIAYCKRPFKSVEEMDDTLIRNHNEVVTDLDIVIHLGDFSFKKRRYYSKQLNGSHIFIRGNHDHKSEEFVGDLLQKNIEGFKVICSHYAMRVWNGSHFGSWNLYGHSHGTLPPVGKQMDVGVDCHNYYPVPFKKVREVLANSECSDRYFKNLPGIKSRGL